MDKIAPLSKNTDSLGPADHFHREAYNVLAFKHAETRKSSSRLGQEKNSLTKNTDETLDFGDIWKNMRMTESISGHDSKIGKDSKPDEDSRAGKDSKTGEDSTPGKELKSSEVSKKDDEPKPGDKSKNDNSYDLEEAFKIEGDKKKANIDHDEPEKKVSASVQEFSKLSLKLFDKIDKNKNGKITLKELSASIEDPSIKGVDAHILATMYKQRRDLQRLSRGSSITREGLKEFNKKLTKHYLTAVDTETMNQLVKDKAWMNKVDTNGDGYLMKAELRKRLEQKDLSSKEKYALKYFIKNHRQLKRLSNDKENYRGLSPRDIERSRQRLEKYKFADVIRGIHWGLYRAKERGEGDLSLYANKDNPLESIKPGAIRQGNIGNCYFLAALASVAATNPQAIKNMIKDNGDGTYTVTFPGAKNEPIKVKAPTRAEQLLYNGGSKYGAWASVIEKAYGKYCQKSYWRRANTNFTGGNTPAEGGDDGGRWGGLKLLTGGVDRVDGGVIDSMPELSVLKERLAKAFSKDGARAIIASRSPFASRAKDGHLSRKHMYSVIGYNPDGADGGIVTIRNPWGSKHGKYGNEFKMTLKQFREKFTAIAYGVRRKQAA